MAVQGSKACHFHPLDEEPISLRVYNECLIRIIQLEFLQGFRLGTGYREFDPLEVAREIEARRRYINRFEDVL